MPNFDRTGPRGQGPVTGRGRGRCGSAADDVTPGRGYGRGRGLRGWGPGGGWGRGRGWGRGGGWRPGPAWACDEPADEQAMLKQRKQALEAALAATDSRLEQLARDAADGVTSEDER